MAHAVDLVLSAMQTALTGLASTGANVSVDRPPENALGAAVLPHLRIYEDGDSTQSYGFADGVDVYERTVRVAVEAIAKGLTSQATVRQIAAEVEAACGAHITIGGKQVRPWYRGCEMNTSAEGDQPVSVRRMNFELVIYTAANAPGTLL